jgi:outer membrane biogenesis lipoprotein LolB
MIAPAGRARRLAQLVSSAPTGCWRLFAPVLALAVLSACAVKAPPRPAGTPTADATALTAHQAATRQCRPLRTATAAIALSGRAGAERIRARLAAGFAAPASVRIEALAPFGPPGLLLASDGAATTLLFPRDKQVLRGASVAELLDAITGLGLGGDELRAVLFGCLALDASRGLSFGDGWQAVEQEGTRVYLRAGAVVAADHRGWLVDYAPGSGGARTVRVRRTLDTGAIDLTAALSQVEMNVEVPASAFVLDVPPDAAAITLEQLRASSPLAPSGER